MTAEQFIGSFIIGIAVQLYCMWFLPNKNPFFQSVTNGTCIVVIISAITIVIPGFLDDIVLKAQPVVILISGAIPFLYKQKDD